MISYILFNFWGEQPASNTVIFLIVSSLDSAFVSSNSTGVMLNTLQILSIVDAAG